MPLSDIVNVQITRETQTVSEQGFGTLMILGTHKRFNDLIRYYSSMRGVAEDFRPSDPEYVAAQAVFSQPITPDQLSIGRRQAASATIEVITAMDNKAYTVTINGNANVLANSTSTAQQSTITFSADFVASNVINLKINGVAMSPAVTRTTDQATTMGLLQTALLTQFSDTIADVEILPDGVNPDRVLKITTKPNVNSVATDVVVTLGVSQPTATVVDSTLPTSVETIANGLVQVINSGQAATATVSAALISGNSTVATVNGTPLSPVVFTTDNATTLAAIATQIQNAAGISTAVSNGTNQIVVTPDAGLPVTVSLVTTLGASQPTWTTTYANEVNAEDNGDGTFTLTGPDADFPYTLDVSTNIINPNAGRVTIEEANPNTLYEITINGTTFQYTSPVEVQTNEQIAFALVSLINADPLLTVGATDNLDGSFELASDDETKTFVCQVTPVLMSYEFGLIIEPLVPSQSAVDALDAIQGVDDNWYALAILDRNSGTVQQVAAWVEARVKIFGTASDDPNIIDQPVGTDTTSIAAILNNLGYVRTFVMYHQDANSDWPECAWFGNCLPFQPGSETWSFKQLASIAYSDLTTNQSNNARNKRANTYEYVGGVGITQNGTMAQGEYIDIIRGVDWLVSTIQTYVYGLLVNSPKVPYTDAGITSIEAQIRRALSQGVTNNFIAEDPEYTVTVPRAASVSQADKAARILRNVTFQATLAGAIQQIRIQGTVTV